jgi:GNAT superfamily N-acetyltransferase
MSGDLHAALEATWPPARVVKLGPWTIREGQGGGKRVSAATADGDWNERDIAAAEAAMRDLGQPALFMIRAGDKHLDEALEKRGYGVLDPTVLYSAPITAFSPFPDPMAGFPHWPPLAIVSAIWADGGIGPARQAVMERVAGPRAAILGRTKDRPSGAAFIARSGSTAMVHALEVPVLQRRQGAATTILGRAAFWAGEHGAERLALAVTAANGPARALYASLGMQAVEEYHYRTI